ncbi:MAG: type II secretion system protein [Gammaproteobacteria bacterium]|nr:type II secretion system protein [Gammaproteobacteria bacterium]
MKQKMKSILGVTLLEIMLVLAIAAMVIVMSVRYYQTATSSEQVNVVMEQIQSIAAAADSMAQGSGSYLTANISSNVISPLLPNNGLTLPWGATIAFGAATATSYLITLNTVPSNECPLIKAKITANSHFTSATPCAAGATTNLIISYTSTT